MFTLIYNLFTRSLVVLLLAMLSVNYLPDKLFHDFQFEPKSMEPINYDSVIPQTWNTKLSDNKPEFIQLNNILGPESIAINSLTNLIYTGLADGRIVELDPSKNYKLRQVLRFNKSPKCLDNIATRANECGRFLQMRFNQNNTLFAIEANSGLYKIDLTSGKHNLIAPKTRASKQINLFNSFAFDPVEPNIVYLTQSSTKWDLLTIIWSFIELESSGQLIAIDIESGKRVVVLDNLMLPNGAGVDVKRDRLVFSETTRARVNFVQLNELRAAFKSAKDGDTLTSIHKLALIPILPGSPDNIHIEGDIAYIALPLVKLNGKELVDHLATMPNVRKAFGRLVFASGKLLEYICENIFHHPMLETTYRELKIGHFIYRILQTDRSAIFEYNLATGASKLYGSNTFGFVSEAVPTRNKGEFLLGSFRSSFIVKAKV